MDGKKIMLSVLITAVGKFSVAQYKPMADKSSIQFVIKNFGIKVNGSFSGITGNILFDAGKLSDAAFDINVDAKTVNTNNDLRDDHLRKETYLNVKDYPAIHFVSTRITSSNKKGFLFIFGKLTIKNQTKDISFPFTADPSDNGYLFTGRFTINRKDFDVGGTSTISDNLEIILSVLAK